MVQLAPTLICDTEQFEEIENVLRPVLSEAAKQVRKGTSTDGQRRQSTRWH